MKLIYMAHPFGGDPANLERARRWFAWLCREFPRNAYICNWIIECEIFDDADPEQRAASLARQCEIARRCNAVLLVGGDISPGMMQEARAAGSVLDLSMIGDEPPEVGSHGWITTPEIGRVAGVLDVAFKLEDVPR